MPGPSDQILTVAQMRDAEGALIAGGTSVDALMDMAGRGAADWVWRVALGRTVTVLCGPGNNGGDGYVIARVLAERGLAVRVIAPEPPRTAAAEAARGAWGGTAATGDDGAEGAVLVDCLFGSGLTRPLSDGHLALLKGLAARHPLRIAVDVPSGVDSDSGAALNPGLPDHTLTLALGAWKFAHWLMPAAATIGARRLVEIGVADAPGAARLLAPPRLSAPAPDAHKYTRGLLGVVAGAMPGAALLAARAAQHAGAGYVKLLGGASDRPDLVADLAPLAEALADPRWGALLVGPGLGRDEAARGQLAAVLALGVPTVLDADVLHLLAREDTATIATPHDGELAAMEHAFALVGGGTKPARALALARASGMVVVAKGPDTVIAAPDGRVALAPPASPWLSTAGSGDVLAGVVASRLATHAEPFAAACQGVWLHGEAARRCGPAFTAGQLAAAVQDAYAAAL